MARHSLSSSLECANIDEVKNRVKKTKKWDMTEEEEIEVIIFIYIQCRYSKAINRKSTHSK